MRGLIPTVVETLETQVERVMLQLREDGNTSLNKYSILMQLASTNTLLFYKARDAYVYTYCWSICH